MESLLPRLSLSKEQLLQKWAGWNSKQREIYNGYLRQAKASNPDHTDKLAYANFSAHRVEVFSVFCVPGYEPDFATEINEEPAA